MGVTQYRRVSGVLFQLTEKEHQALCRPAWDALESLRQGSATQTQWFNLALRLRFAFALAIENYADITVLGADRAYCLAIGVYDRAVQTDPVAWFMDDDDAEYVRWALIATDTMQRQVPRKNMAKVMREVVVYMRTRYVADAHRTALPPRKL